MSYEFDGMAIFLHAGIFGVRSLRRHSSKSFMMKPLLIVDTCTLEIFQLGTRPVSHKYYAGDLYAVVK
jgi:hypothetical protein